MIIWLAVLLAAVVPSSLPQLFQSQPFSAPVALEDTDAADRQRVDLQSAALLLVQVLVAGTAAVPGAEAMQLMPDSIGLQRLLFDVFHEEVEALREYCLGDEEVYGGFVELMDEQEGAGWEMLGELMHGRVAAGQLLQQSKFLQGLPWQLQEAVKQ
jgi:hypothetical protein